MLVTAARGRATCTVCKWKGRPTCEQSGDAAPQRSGVGYQLATDTTAVAVAPASARDCAPAAPDLDGALQPFPDRVSGRLSDNTRRIYLDDLHTFLAFCRQQGHGLRDMDRQLLLRAYVAHLATVGRTDGPRPTGYARVSIVRKLTALRTFYNFLVQEGWFKSTPVPSARSFPVKVERPLPTFLVEGEAQRLLAAADDDETPEGLRSRAIMELFYASGVRLAELHGMNLGDVERGRREILVRGKGDKERWVLYGDEASQALDHYLSDARPQLSAGSETTTRCSLTATGSGCPGAASRRSSVTTPPRRTQGRHPPPHPAAQLRQPYAGRRRRFARDPGIAGPQQRVNHADLYPHHQAGSAPRVHGLPPAGGSGGRRRIC